MPVLSGGLRSIECSLVTVVSLCLMIVAAGRRVFREYLRLEYSEENMLFWLAVEELKNEQDERRMLEQVRLIYEDFISILSPREASERTIHESLFCELHGPHMIFLHRAFQFNSSIRQ